MLLVKISGLLVAIVNMYSRDFESFSDLPRDELITNSIPAQALIEDVPIVTVCSEAFKCCVDFALSIILSHKDTYTRIFCEWKCASTKDGKAKYGRLESAL